MTFGLAILISELVVALLFAVVVPYPAKNFGFGLGVGALLIQLPIVFFLHT